MLPYIFSLSIYRTLCAPQDKLGTAIVLPTVFVHYCSTYYKAVRVGGGGHPLGMTHCTLAPFTLSRHFLQKKDDFLDDFSCADTVSTLLCTHEFND